MEIVFGTILFIVFSGLFLLRYRIGFCGVCGLNTYGTGNNFHKKMVITRRFNSRFGVRGWQCTKCGFLVK